MINDAIGDGLDIAFQNRAAAVSGTVINDDNLNIRQGGGPNGGDNFSDRISLVIAGITTETFMGRRVTQQESRRRRSKRRENPAAGYRLTRSKRCITQSHAVTRATIRVFPAFRRLIRASGD
jgi:hypothetical protein